MSTFSKFLAGSIVMLGLAISGTASAQAGYGSGYDSHAPACHYDWVTTWEFRTIHDVIYVTEYDHCGHPFQARKVIVKTIKVPVRKLVKVCH